MDIAELHSLFLRSDGVSKDTRTLLKNQIYFALKGDNFDGNKYAQNALDLGAKAVVVDDSTIIIHSDKRYILVDNVLSTLQALSTYHREQFNIPVIGITGSNGKTTTKELTAAVLSSKYKVLYTQGNLNNHIGVPLTLLDLTQEHSIAIIEMGANHPNDITELCKIARPTHGYITNIGNAHLEGFGTIEGVYKAKTALFDYLENSHGIIFLNDQDSYLNSYQTTNANIVTLEELSPVKSQSIHLIANYNNHNIKTQLFGEYNIENVAAAVTIGRFFDVKTLDITSSIEQYAPVNKRSQSIQYKGARIILDAYNANPTSMNASLQAFNKELTNSSINWVILGDMLELGKYSLKMHKELITSVAIMPLQKIVLVGKHLQDAYKCVDKTKTKNIITFHSVPDCKKWFDNQEITDTLILVKGSRSIALEKLFD